jgi:hypothetical protein
VKAIPNENQAMFVALLTDPFGHRWHLATRKEDITPAEMQRWMDAAYARP